MPGAFRLGNLAGVDVYVNYSWLIILVLLTVSTAIGWFPAFYPGYSFGIYLLLGLIAALLFLLSVLLHELAHSLVARARGLTVKSIVLYVFGGVSNIEQEPKGPGVEFQMAFVGPLTNILLALLCYLLLLPFRGNHSATGAVLSYLAISNLLLGILNLVPGFPLDGGRVLRSIVWRVTGDANRATMSRDPMTVPSNISLQKLVDDYFLPQGLRSALVMQGDQLGGLITLSDIRNVPREEWSKTPVGFAMVSVDKLHVVTPHQSLRDALPLMSGQDVNQLPVVEDGRLVGVLSRDAIIRALQVRQELGRERGR
jgi:Zn-dependent protease/CBS domain-containing protein